MSAAEYMTDIESDGDESDVAAPTTAINGAAAGGKGGDGGVLACLATSCGSFDHGCGLVVWVCLTLLLVGMFLLAVAAPSLLFLLYNTSIRAADFIFLEPLTWLLFLFTRQLLAVSKSGLKNGLVVVYNLAAFANGVATVLHMPHVHDGSGGHPFWRQLIGAFYVAITFLLLEAKWQGGPHPLSDKPYLDWNRSRLGLTLEEVQHALLLVMAVMAGLIGGLVVHIKCTASRSQQAHAECSPLDTESAIVDVWLWYNFLDLTLKRTAHNERFYNRVSTFMMWFALVEHIALSAENSNNSDIIMGFGIARRALQLAAVTLVAVNAEGFLSGSRRDTPALRDDCQELLPVSTPASGKYGAVGDGEEGALGGKAPPPASGTVPNRARRHSRAWSGTPQG